MNKQRVAILVATIILVLGTLACGLTTAELAWDDKAPDEDYIVVGEQYLIPILIASVEETELPDGDTQVIILGQDKFGHLIKLACSNVCDDITIEEKKVTEFRATPAGWTRDGFTRFAVFGVGKRNLPAWKPAPTPNINMGTGA